MMTTRTVMVASLCVMLVIMSVSVGVYAATTIVVTGSQNWIKDIDREVAADFTAKTGIAVDFQPMPDDQYTTLVKTKLASGEGPDIFMCPGGVGMMEFLPDKYFLDLSDQPWGPRLKGWAKDGATYQGKVVALNRWSVDGWAFLYNPVMFAKYNLKAPTTYAEFLKVCETLLANGITPIYEWAQDQWHVPLTLNAIGYEANQKYPGLYNKLNANEIKFADVKEFETVLTQMLELAQKGYMGEDYMAQTWTQTIDAAASGKFAMFLVYSTWQNEAKAKYPDQNFEQWEMFPSPLGDCQSFATSAGGEVTVINKNSKNIDAAKQYLAYIAEPDPMKKYYAARKDLGETSVTDVEGMTTLAFKSVLKNSPHGAGLDLQGGVMFYDLLKFGQFIQEMLMGTKTPKQVLEAIDAEREKMFKVMGAK